MSYSIKYFNRLAGKAVHGYQMISDGERILVGLSGGKDSLALLKYLADRRRRTPISYELVAVHLDLGYENADQKEILLDHVRGMDVEHYFESTDYAPLAHTSINRENPCFLCSKLRRKRLFQLAGEKNCRKVALGHNRDDLIQTLLLNIFYSGEISTMVPVQSFFNGLLTVIRPLCMVPEDRIQKWSRSGNSLFWKMTARARKIRKDPISRR